MTSRQRTSPVRIDTATAQMYRQPAFIEAVNRMANHKCMALIKSGRLRVVAPVGATPPVRYRPRIDIIDDPSLPRLVALVEIPGIQTNDLSLEIKEGQLIIQGERRFRPVPNTLLFPENPSQQPTPPIDAMDMEGVNTDLTWTPSASAEMSTKELCFGTFHRAIRVPDGIKGSEILANLQDGMLTVTWPRVVPAGSSPRSRPASRESGPSTSIPTAGTALQ